MPKKIPFPTQTVLKVSGKAGPIIKTPLYTVVTGKDGKVSLTWNTKKFVSPAKTSWQSKYTNAQKFVDSEVLRLCEPYTPFLAGILIFSGSTGTDVGSGLVQWTVPYARYQYYGKVVLQSPFGGGAIVTSRNLKYHGGGKRGSHWFERMKEVSGKAIIAGAKRFMT